jgi:cytochrome c biogenesis protein CcdA
MTLALAAIPLALLAGVVGVLSPCVWPLVPAVTSAAAGSGRGGPVWLASGLALSFAAAGTFLTWLLVATGLDPELFRYVAAGLLLSLAAVLLAAGVLSGKLLQRWHPGLVSRGRSGRRLLGGSLLLLGVLVLTGLDKRLEALAVNLLPAWIFTL